ncbi:hypothetical protein RhiirB3_459174 [Rhizophagus irregularis]|nr:hypothetical protein RhiirB3_459174 [Rhizophagus irregularis]
MDIEIDWPASLNIIMKEFNDGISSLSNDSTAYNLKNYLEILPTFTMLNQRILELYETSRCCRCYETIELLSFNYHAKLLQILNERSVMIFNGRIFMKQSRELLIKNFILGNNDNTFKDAISKEFVFNIKGYISGMKDILSGKKGRE